MKKFIALLYISFICPTIFGQFAFYGFDQQQCGLYTDHPYTYENFVDCISGAGYDVFKNDVWVWGNCPFNNSCHVKKIVATSDTSAFLIDKCFFGHSVYKTTNSFDSVSFIGSGSMNYIAYYLVSPNSGYLLTFGESWLFIRRTSDIQLNYFIDNNVDTDTIFYDTIIGEPYCDIDTLSFKLGYNGNVISYAIVFNSNPINIESQITTEEFTIFPNPTNEYFRLNYNSNTKDEKLEILNKYGVLIKSFPVMPGKQYYVGDIPYGLYLVRIKSKNTTFYQKLIIR